MGILTFEDVRERMEQPHVHLYARDAMGPVGTPISAGLKGTDALQALVEAGRDPAAVVGADGALVGLLHRGDIGRWLALHHTDALEAEPQRRSA